MEFDWDDGNIAHLAVHQVTPEFEGVLNNDPPDIDYELINTEERYCSAGLTKGYRCFRLCLRCATAEQAAYNGVSGKRSGTRKPFSGKPR
jgi:hypothetical protein